MPIKQSDDNHTLRNSSSLFFGIGKRIEIVRKQINSRQFETAGKTIISCLKNLENRENITFLNSVLTKDKFNKLFLSNNDKNNLLLSILHDPEATKGLFKYLTSQVQASPPSLLKLSNDVVDKFFSKQDESGNNALMLIACFADLESFQLALDFYKKFYNNLDPSHTHIQSAIKCLHHMNKRGFNIYTVEIHGKKLSDQNMVVLCRFEDEYLRYNTAQNLKNDSDHSKKAAAVGAGAGVGAACFSLFNEYCSNPANADGKPEGCCCLGCCCLDCLGDCGDCNLEGDCNFSC